MRKSCIILLALVLLPFCTPVLADEVLIDDFEEGLAPGWGVQPFAGYTDYRVVAEGSGRVMQAESRGTASSLYFRTRIDLRRYPLLSWRWKIAATVPGADARFRESDDYPARVYVVFPGGLFGRTRAINYIWANRLSVGEVVPSPFSDDSRMVAVESGDSRAGEWVTERRNVYEDYRRIFGREPGKVRIIAIMTDSDNTGTAARAWYDDIRFLKE